MPETFKHNVIPRGGKYRFMSAKSVSLKIYRWRIDRWRRSSSSIVFFFSGVWNYIKKNGMWIKKGDIQNALNRLRSSVGSDSNHLPDLNEKWLNLSDSPSRRMLSSMKNLERFRRFCCSQLFLPTFDRARFFFLKKNWCFLYIPASNRRPTSSLFEWKLLVRMQSSLATLKRSRRNGFPKTFIRSFDRAQMF